MTAKEIAQQEALAKQQAKKKAPAPIKAISVVAKEPAMVDPIAEDPLAAGATAEAEAQDAIADDSAVETDSSKTKNAEASTGGSTGSDSSFVDIDDDETDGSLAALDAANHNKAEFLETQKKHPKIEKPKPFEPDPLPDELKLLLKRKY
mgnify:CR=1 FL=1